MLKFKPAAWDAPDKDTDVCVGTIEKIMPDDFMWQYTATGASGNEPTLEEAKDMLEKEHSDCTPPWSDEGKKGDNDE